LVALEVHEVAVLALDPYLDAWHLGEVQKNLRGLSLGELCAVKINANLDAAIGIQACFQCAICRRGGFCHLDASINATMLRG
jgi:hypothetical protein